MGVAGFRHAGEKSHESVGRQRPLDWRKLTSGEQIYSDDLHRRDSGQARILRSPHAYARILEVHNGRSRLSSVKAIVTAADFPPGARYLHEGAGDRPAPIANGVVASSGQEWRRRCRHRGASRGSPASHSRPLPRSARSTEHQDVPCAGSGPPARAPFGSGERRSRISDAGCSPDVGIAASIILWPAAQYLQYHACMEPGVTIAHWSQEEARLYLWSSTAAPYYVVRESPTLWGCPDRPGRLPGGRDRREFPDRAPKCPTTGGNRRTRSRVCLATPCASSSHVAKISPPQRHPARLPDRPAPARRRGRPSPRFKGRGASERQRL